MPNEAIIISDIARERLVREEIIKYEEISHNKLLKIIVYDKKLMAKATYAKTIKSLLTKGLIDYKTEKNKKIYYAESQKAGELTDLEKFIKDQEKKLPTTSTDFATKTLTEKANEVKFLFSLYETNASLNTLVFALGEMPKKEYDKASNLMNRFLKIQLSVWKNDKDAKYLIAELLMSVIKTSPFGQLQKMANEYA